MENGKLKPLKEIESLVLDLKKKGKRVVTCNGSFDLFHAGHLFFLSEAKRQGDILIVGLNSDKSVRTYKGPQRPLVDERHRAILLSGLSCVDYIVLFDETDPRHFLSIVQPDVHCNGAEYGEDCIEAKTVKKNGGRLHLIHLYGDLRTSHLIQKIKET